MSTPREQEQQSVLGKTEKGQPQEPKLKGEGPMTDERLAELVAALRTNVYGLAEADELTAEIYRMRNALAAATRPTHTDLMVSPEAIAAMHAPEQCEETMRALAERLLERLCLLDFTIVEHHSSSIMRPGVGVCPVCSARGSGFFYDTYNLIERAQNLFAADTSEAQR